jgi:putative pyruvate formate lyase activating enzyme
MGQYTPEFAEDAPYPNLHRHLTTFEYQSVQKCATDLGFDGFSQDLTSATSQYTPEF